MGCCGGFIGQVFNPVVDAVKDVGSFVDDAVNDVIPGGWATVAAVTGATMGVPTDFGLGEAAAAEGASGLASLPSSVLGAGDAFATGSELAAGLETAAPWGISAGAPAAEFGTFNPATISGIGADTSALGGMEWLGGTGSLPVGTAGLTAEQISNAALAGSVGSNAASGLGYLGGAESLPSGTAGITGVTNTPIWDSIKNTVSDVANPLGQSLTGGNTASLLARGLTGGLESSPIGYNMNKNPFSYPTQQPIQGSNTISTVPPELQNQNLLASLLRK